MFFEFKSAVASWYVETPPAQRLTRQARVRTKTIKKAARKIIEVNYAELEANNFALNKKVCSNKSVARIPSKRLRNKIAGYVTTLMNRISKGPVRGISLKLQEEERERKDNYVPEQSDFDVEKLRVNDLTVKMLQQLGFSGLTTMAIKSNDST